MTFFGHIMQSGSDLESNQVTQNISPRFTGRGVLEYSDIHGNNVALGCGCSKFMILSAIRLLTVCAILIVIAFIVRNI